MPAWSAGIRIMQLLATALSLYQAAITLAGYARPRRIPRPSGEERTFAIVVCARNEGAVIDGILDDVRAQEYPKDRLHVTVVAHNCSDDTARVARCRGARVIELNDGRKGKLEALRAAMAAMPPSDYVGFFDADARIPADFLQAVADGIENHPAVQVKTVPAVPTNELEAAYGFGRASRNALWWEPRSRLGLGTTITGSGFFIRPHLMNAILPSLRSGTDDLELTTRLAASGVSVRYLDSTQTMVEEPAALGPSINQRSRWVRGHMGTVGRTWPALALRGLRGDLRAADLALFLVVPTRVLTRTAVGAGLVLRVLAPASSIPATPMLIAAAGETLIPLIVCTKAGILTFNRQGARLALEHGLLGFLWFPIGLWSLVTARRVSWGAIPRHARNGTGTE
jgi:cellulose synthase/poly-beta-1,6-N-acetylglucosamine synthase-like glycosyltransferase